MKAKQPTKAVNLRMRKNTLDNLKEMKELSGKTMTRILDESLHAYIRKEKPRLAKLAKLQAL